MKLLDVLGTNSEIFSLGVGEKKIELRSIDGVLHFRNFGTGWQRASSESLRESLRLRTWSTGLLIGDRELFLYNDSIWYSKNTLTTSASFSNDSSNFIKIADTANFLKIDVSTAETTNLTVETSNSIYFEGESIGSFISVVLPDAENLTIGRQFLFINGSNVPVRVYRYNNSLSYFTVASAASLGLIITNNETPSGAWSTLSFSGSGGGGGVYQLDVTISLSNYPGNSNPFSVGDFTYYDTTDKYWKLAYSNNFSLDMLGIITSSAGNKIKIAFFGLLEFPDGLTFNGSPIVEGTTYYLTDSSSVPGKFTNLLGTNNRKLFTALSTTTIFLFNDHEYERFNERKVYELTNGSSVNLNEGYSYRLDGFIQDDSNLTIFSGYIYQSTPVDALIETSSDIILDSDSSGGLCFFMDGNNLKMKNNLGSTKKIIIFRKKIK
jgi:hypothetical protein